MTATALISSDLKPKGKHLRGELGITSNFLRTPLNDSFFYFIDLITERTMEESNPELESFRQKWKKEVSAKSKAEGKSASNAGPSRSSRRPQAAPRLATERAVKLGGEEDEYLESRASHGQDGASENPSDEYGESSKGKTRSREPRSALEHYEKAVERESQGSLGDSLSLYRKAFKVRSWVHVAVQD
jgi:F-box protein 9